MRRLVIDASVVIMLFFREQHSDAADECAGQADELLAPDLVWPEVANVIWQRRRRGEITDEQAAGILAEVLRFPLHVRPSADLLLDALDLAVRFDRTVYDSLYVALAVQTNSILLTGDRRLANALSRTPLATHIAWVGATG